MKKIHFIGIGGIGVSALAQYYLSQSFKVSGSDLGDSPILKQLRNLGAEIFIGHKEENLPADAELVIYSVAIEQNNPELKKAKEFGIKYLTYGQALGELTKKMFTIAVSGMHGKSTTTAMIALVLEKAGLDPTVIVGTKLKEFNNTNFRLGKSKYLVIEADEYNATCLNYWPKILVLLNLEPEHLDYYRDLGHIMETFREYAGHLGEGGVLVINEEDINVRKISQKSKVKSQKYNSKVKIEGLNLKIPGEHMVSNAKAAIAVARILNIPDEISIAVLNDFNGTWRRFEYKGEINGAKIYDDYAHHPTEVEITIRAAKELIKDPEARLWIVYQPHQYQRTFKLFDRFVNAFDEADKIILLPIYSVAGRENEEIKQKVNSKILVEEIKKRGKDILYLENIDDIESLLKRELHLGDICLIMGAGDIYKLTERLFFLIRN